MLYNYCPLPDFPDTIMSPPALPQELCDFVVDHMHAERPALGACALVCRAWVPASRFHLFEHISLTRDEGHAAARLNDLLASPHATIAGAVRRLDLYNALAPIQVRDSLTGCVHVKKLVEIVPRISQLHRIHTLTLSDLPFDILPAFSEVHTLFLVGITAGPGLLRLAEYLPSLTNLTFQRVHAIPYRPPASPTGPSPPRMEKLRCVTVRGSSIAFLGWMAVLAPHTSTLDLGELHPSEVPYLTRYLQALGRSLESLELGLSAGTDVREFTWDEVARVLGKTTRLSVSFDVLEWPAEEEKDEGNTESRLRACFPELEKRGMLDVRYG
jgi:hypothetical protein